MRSPAARRAWGGAVVGAFLLAATTCAPTGSEEGTGAGAEEEPEEFRDAHRERFARYEVAAEDLPAFTRYGIKVDSLDPIIVRHDWFTLRLVLGRRFDAGAAGRYRTTSRYELATRNSVVSAESVFAVDDVESPDLVRTVHVCHDGGTGEIFLHEEHSWSVHRFILMHPAPGGTRVSYVQLPFLRPSPPSALPRILGIREGTLYVAQDGVIYGYPLRELLEVEDLSYGIG